MANRIDPYAENDYYEKIQKDLVYEKIEIVKNEVNAPPQDGKKYLKIVLISDTHDQLKGLSHKIPNGDVLIHAGDFTNAGELPMVNDFNECIGKLPHPVKLVVAGNHELGFDDSEDWEKREPMWKDQGTPKGYELLTNCTYLHDSAVTVYGKTFYGASWHPLQGYPFSLMRGPDMEEAWAKMPENVDVLITHSPPLGYLDTFNDERWGCRHLLAQVQAKKPALHVFGHVHECYGAARNQDTKFRVFVNAAICDKKNKLKNEPLVFYLPL